MSKSSLKSAIAGLKINAPFDLRKQGQVALAPPRVTAQVVRSQTKQTQTELTQKEAPQTERAQAKGFFMLARSAFADSDLQELSGDAFRLFIWMSAQAWGYQDSNGTLRASIGYMCAGTGVSHATVSRALGQLKQMQLVELVRTDFKRGNTWRVSNRAVFVPEPGGGPRERKPLVPQSEHPHFESPQVKGEGDSNREGSSLKLRQGVSHFEGESINSTQILKTKNNSLSCEIVNSQLRIYFAETKPTRKRESELQAFWELRRDYSEAEIAQCFVHLEARGLPGSGATCHSPMAYLGKAMAPVILEVQARTEAQAEATARENVRVAIKTREQILTEREEREAKQREAAFVAQFPTAQAQAAEIACHAESIPYFRIDSPAARSIAICAWWESQTTSKKESLLSQSDDI